MSSPSSRRLRPQSVITNGRAALVRQRDRICSVVVRSRTEIDELGLRLILYCSTGERSAMAAATLRSMGYRDVRVLDGGIEAWKREGLPVEMP